MEWFRLGTDVDALSLSEVRVYGDKIVKKLVCWDAVDERNVRNEYETHAYVWEHAPWCATRPYPPERDGDYVYLAQDLAPGVAWEDMVEQDDWVYVALGKALARVHGLGVLHNDLHAGNVFVDVASQRVTLIDWGSATRGGDGGATLARETRLLEGHAPLLQHAAHRRLVETVTTVF